MVCKNETVQGGTIMSKPNNWKSNFKPLEVKIEDGIKHETYRGNVILNDEAIAQLRKMKEGQSFVAQSQSQVLTIINWGKRHDKKFVSRKIWEGSRKGPDAPHHFRVWLVKGKPNPLPDQKRPAEVQTHSLSDDVLAMAELRADNKKIVEDIDHIKKGLKEELGRDIDDDGYYGVNTNADEDVV